jgi:predicted ATPase
MPSAPNKLSQFWQELKRRKVLPFLIGYIAACPAIIEFFINASETFSVSQETIKLLYLLSAAGLPVVILLPWFINRKRRDLTPEELMLKEFNAEPRRKKVLHNLPAHLPGFIGREKEIMTIRELVNGNRLVTLTGAGGCGKTRLAIQFALQVLSEYTDGVWLVELAPVTVPEHIDQAIAEVFKIKEQPDSTLIQIVTHYLRSKNLLLILDNCEHLITACSGIVEQILKSTEHVTILSTSREALNVYDEVALRVPSLSLPQNDKELSADELNHYEAIQLFVTRAKSKQQEFLLSDQNAQPVLQICKRLDGIPLAIELAASRIGVFNPEVIVERLDDRFRLLTGGSRTALERHKTLQATIDWSYDLLSDQEKEIFHLLSVFVGGFDLEAYESICGAVTGNRDELTDLLTGLIEKSLVVTRNTKEGDYRYQLLETVRHYAKEKLLESGKSETARESHFQHYYRLAENAYMKNIERYEYWIDRLEVEYENMIVALEWSRNDPERRLQLAGVLGWFWVDHSHFRLGLDYLKELEDIPDDKILTRVRAMTYSGVLSLVAGHPESFAISKKSIELWNKLNNTREKVKALYFCSIIISIFQDYRTAEDMATEMREIAMELKDDYLLLWARTAQTYIHIYQLQVDSAEPLAEQSLKDANALNDSMMKGQNLHCYSDCALMRKDYKETEKRYSIALKHQLELGNHVQSLHELTGMIYGLSGQGRYKKALRLQGAVDAKLNEYGIPMFQIKFWLDWFEEYVNGARRAVGEEKTAQYEQEGRQMGFDKAVEYALDFEKD